MKRRRGRALVGGEAGSRNRLWRDFSFVASSRYREKVLRSLAARPRLPSQIAEDTSLRIGHVSRALRELSGRDLVECLTPEARARGRLYAITQPGLSLDTYFRDASRRYNPVAKSATLLGFVPKIRAQFALLVVRHVSREFGASAVRDVLRGWGVSPDDLGADDWLSVDAYNELLELLEARFGDGSFQFIRSVSAKVVPAISTVRAEISRLVPMEVLVERAPVVYSKEWNYGRLEVRTGKHRAGFLHYEWLPTPAFCAGFHGAYEGILRSRKLSGTVTKTRCVRRGDDHCEYVMEWS